MSEQPKSMLSEQNVIGSLLINNESINDICDILQPEMFYNSLLGKAYESCVKAFRENKPFDMVTMIEYIKENSNADEATIFEVIKECTQVTATSSNIRLYAESVINYYIPRLCQVRMQEVQKHPETAMQIIQDLNKLTLDITQNTGIDYHSVSEIADMYSGQYFKEKEGKRLQIGIKCLDEAIGDLEGGDVFVIGARPAVGKSALAMQILNGLARNGNKIGYFNLEMTEKQIFERFIANESGIGLTRIRRAIKFLNDEEEKYNKAVDILRQKDRIIISSGSKTTNRIRSITQKEQFDAIVIDYLQLILPSGRYRGNRVTEVGEISHALKAIATDMGIPVILLAQLNREIEGRNIKKPQMSDLRESGDIENDASIILFLWNEDEDDRSKKGYVVAKQRQGETSEGKLIFNGDLMKFYGEDEFVDVTPSLDLDIPFDIGE